jgi:hypothetical protein
MKFHENVSNGSQIVPCRWMDGRTIRHTDRQRGRHDEAASCNFANMPKNVSETQNIKIVNISLWLQTFTYKEKVNFIACVQITYFLKMFVMDSCLVGM